MSAKAGVYIASLQLCNLIVNKVPSGANAKSKAAFRREWDQSSKDVIFAPIDKALEWLEEALPAPKEVEQKPKKARKSKAK